MDNNAVLLYLLLPLLGALIFLKAKLSPTRQKNLTPPGPPTLPMIGNLHQLGKILHQSLSQLAKKHGPVMLLHFGRVPTIVVSSAEAAKTVMRTHDLDTCNRAPYASGRRLTYEYRDMAFGVYDEYWREMRKICTLEIFSVKRVQSNWSVREEELARTISEIADLAASGTPMNLSEAAFVLSASIIFRIALGVTFQETGLDSQKFHEMVHEVAVFITTPTAAEYFPYVGWILDWFSGLHKRREAIFSRTDRLFQSVIDAHRNPSRTKQKNDDIVEVFFKIMKDDTGFGSTLTDANIKGILFNMFLGGVDTGAITTVWAMAELAKNPKVMKKAQDEVRGRFLESRGDSMISDIDIENLPYIKAVVRETLRLHPPVPLMVPRETIAPFDLEGYPIPPKTTILVNSWSIGRDPKYWKDPDEFSPERFDGSPVDFKGQHFELLPFGSGRRICPAVYIGSSSVELAVANMLYHFDWRLPDGMSPDDLDMNEEEGPSISTSKKIPLKLIPVKPH